MVSKDELLNEIINEIKGSLNQLDDITKEHSKRMMELSEEIVPYIKLSKKDSEVLSLVAALHDIGKKFIASEILNKNGNLNEEDWQEVKKHPKLGYDLMGRFPALVPVAEAILYHHERWDGTGYPSHRSKDSIPLLSRVISVLDAFDAMTNDRPYRKALSVKCALNEIKRNAGVQFDPVVSNCFVKMYTTKYIQ